MPINLAVRAPTKGDEVEVGSGVRTPGRRYGFAMAPSAPVKGAEIEQPKVVEEPEDSGEAPVQEPATPAGTPSQPAAPAAPSQPAAPVAAPKKPEATMPAAELIAMAQAATTEAELQAIAGAAAGRVTVTQAVQERRSQI